MKDEKIILETGKICTVSGEWETEGRIGTVIYLLKGEVMPRYCGKCVQWILIRKG